MSIFGLAVFSIFYGLDRIARVPTVRLLSNIVGTGKVAIIVAWVTVIGGLLRLEFGTYFEAFLLAELACFTAALMAMCIGKTQPADAALSAR
jgi:hypothetical protein